MLEFIKFFLHVTLYACTVMALAILSLTPKVGFKSLLVSSNKMSEKKQD